MSKWEAYGIYFGYPRCCVDNFLRNVMIPFWYENKNLYPDGRLLDGTGFIPCPECNKEHTEESLTALINSKRHCKDPFPEDFNFEKNAKEIDKLIKEGVLEYD